MTYRKSKSGSEFVMLKDTGFILSITNFPATDPKSVSIKFTRNEVLADDVRNNDIFDNCTQREFEQAYTRAMKLIEL